MSPLVTETKRILREHFGKSDTEAHWMAANNWTDHGKLSADLALARQQALTNLSAKVDVSEALRLSYQHLSGSDPEVTSGGIKNADLRDIVSSALDALKALVEDQWFGMSDDDLQYELSQGNEMVRPYIQARAIIAKAEGRKPANL